jgi:predicted RNA-binding Zn-ribbon protein involved in translation (DUF1610 family)
MQTKPRRRLADAIAICTFALALAVPVYVAFRNDRRDRSAYVGWRSGEYVYEASARFLGWRFSVRLDAPRRDFVSISDPAAGNPYATLNGPGSYPSNQEFGAGFDSYPMGAGGEVPGENPQWLGFGGGPFSSPGTSHRVYTIWVPVWFLVLALALPGARWIVRRRVAVRRVREGLCVGCGYDLRGAAHDRCPECGSTRVTRPESAVDRLAEAPRPASGPP